MFRKLGIGMATTLLLFPVTTVSTASTDQPNCTITGTAKSDRINGTSGNDVICGLGGNDIIYGQGGEDIIYGGSGNDSIYGQAGNDEIYGELGNDRIYGDAGSDELFGDQGNDIIDGGNDSDWIEGDLGNDNLSGGSSDDVIKGEGGTDAINGSSGDDKIDGGTSRDNIRSGTGSDNCSKDKLDFHFDPCKLDANGPEFGMTATVVREFQAGSTVTFSWSLSDETGIEGSWGYIGGAPGWITQWCGFGIEARLLDGNSKQGTYGFDCTIPEDAVNENYSLFVSAVDVLGNSSYGHQFAFNVTGGQQDNQHPQIQGVSMPETAKAGDTIPVTVKVSDESGVKGIWTWLAFGGYSFSDGSRTYSTQTGEPILIDGDALNGKYLQEHKLWDFAPKGQYTLWVSVVDIYGNRSFEQTQQVITVID